MYANADVNNHSVYGKCVVKNLTTDFYVHNRKFHNSELTQVSIIFSRFPWE